jgi:hypothetical protein
MSLLRPSHFTSSLVASLRVGPAGHDDLLSVRTLVEPRHQILSSPTARLEKLWERPHLTIGLLCKPGGTTGTSTSSDAHLVLLRTTQPGYAFSRAPSGTTAVSR